MLIWASVKKKNEKKIVQERKTLEIVEIVEYSKTSLSIHMT